MYRNMNFAGDSYSDSSMLSIVACREIAQRVTFTNAYIVEQMLHVIKMDQVQPYNCQGFFKWIAGENGNMFFNLRQMTRGIIFEGSCFDMA